jgi:glycosyltransferase involved in cell wall biosynthesis
VVDPAHPSHASAPTAAELRIGLAAEGDPGDLLIRSGPAGVLAGLAGLGHRPVGLNLQPTGRPFHAAFLLAIAPHLRPGDLADLRSAVARLWTHGTQSRPMRVTGRWALSRHLRQAGPLDGLIQFNAALVPAPSAVPMVTLQDSTLAQAIRAYPWAYLEGMRERERAKRQRVAELVYRSTVACLGVTHWVTDSLASDYGVAADCVHVVGLGPNFPPAEMVPARDWRIPRLLFAGVDWKRKNGAAVLAAFTELRAERPGATLDIVGEHPPLAVAGVRGHGRLRVDREADRARMQELFQQSTGFLMPSLHEPAGIAYLDAAGAGIGSIGTTDGGAATMIGDGGIVVDPRSPRELLEAMRALSDPDTAAALGERARRHVELFTWRKVAERILRALAPRGVDCSELADFL